jgi:hypothetical protein
MDFPGGQCSPEISTPMSRLATSWPRRCIPLGSSPRNRLCAAFPGRDALRLRSGRDRGWVERGRPRIGDTIRLEYESSTMTNPGAPECAGVFLCARRCSLPQPGAALSIWSLPTLGPVNAKEIHQPSSPGQHVQAPACIHPSSPSLASHVKQTYRSLRSRPRCRLFHRARAENRSQSATLRPGTIG